MRLTCSSLLVAFDNLPDVLAGPLGLGGDLDLFKHWGDLSDDVIQLPPRLLRLVPCRVSFTHGCCEEAACCLLVHRSSIANSGRPSPLDTQSRLCHNERMSAADPHPSAEDDEDWAVIEDLVYAMDDWLGCPPAIRIARERAVEVLAARRERRRQR